MGAAGAATTPFSLPTHCIATAWRCWQVAASEEAAEAAEAARAAQAKTGALERAQLARRLEDNHLGVAAARRAAAAQASTARKLRELVQQNLCLIQLFSNTQTF